MENIKAANKLKIDTVIKNLEKRNITGHYCDTKEDACELILSIIQNKSTVSWGGSATVNATGIKKKLEDRDVKIIDPYGTKDPAEGLERRRQSLMADYFLMSTNAVTLEGELLNIDGTSNRVAALCFGPKKVIVVAGANKIISKLEDALPRAKVNAAVANAVRLNRKTPCTVTGFCSDCLSKDCICCNIVTTRFCSTPGRIEMILINENLGY
jgi:Uncharacterised ACR, YkgG family COG1556.